MKKILAIVVICFLLGCKKETTPQTTLQLLSKNWKVTAMDILTPLQGTPLSGLSTNLYNPNECQFKQVWKFNINGNLTLEDDRSCRIGALPGSTTGSWKLSDDNSKFAITLDGLSLTYYIVNLTETKLTVQRILVTGPMDLLVQVEYSKQ